MQLFFIDESGTIPPKDKIGDVDQFTLGGIVIPEDLWHEISKELTSLKNNFQIVGEIKWRYFSLQKPGAQSNPLSHLNSDQKEALRNALYALVSKFKAVRLICAVVDIKSAYKLSFVKCENDLYWFAYKQIIERFQYYLQDLSRTVGSKINGIVVCDHRQPKDDHQLRILHQNLLSGADQNLLKCRNLIEGVFIAPSHLSVGIQLADMVAGAVYRQFIRNAPRFFNLIKNAFRKRQDGEILGYGLIKCPKE